MNSSTIASFMSHNRIRTEARRNGRCRRNWLAPARSARSGLVAAGPRPSRERRTSAPQADRPRTGRTGRTSLTSRARGSVPPQEASLPDPHFAHVCSGFLLRLGPRIDQNEALGRTSIGPRGKTHSMSLNPDGLHVLLPAVAKWFRDRFGEPTPPQKLGWPAIASGKNTLLFAPTGSGKTLAAFLACLDHLWRNPRSAEGSVSSTSPP